MKVNLNQMLEIGGQKRIELFVPTKGNNNPEIFVSNLLSKIEDEGRKPRVLWNMRPWDNYNFIHAIYCSKLKQLIDVGFNCQIILYDKLVEKIQKISSPRDLENLKRNVLKNIEWLCKSGLDSRSTEFLWESELWKNINFEDFSNTITYIAQLFEDNLNNVRVDELLDRLYEIYYEILIECDFVLTGGKDAKEIWGMLRKNILHENLLTDYQPPVVLVFPTIHGLTNKRIEPSITNDSLTIHDDHNSIMSKLESASNSFLSDLYELLILPSSGNNIQHQGSAFLCKSFEELETLNSGFNIRSYAASYLFELFKSVKNE